MLFLAKEGRKVKSKVALGEMGGLPTQLLSFRDFLREIKNMDFFGGGKHMCVDLCFGCDNVEPAQPFL